MFPVLSLAENFDKSESRWGDSHNVELFKQSQPGGLATFNDEGTKIALDPCESPGVNQQGAQRGKLFRINSLCPR